MSVPDFLCSKKSKDMHIDELAKEAKEKGMSYGQLKAERYKQQMAKIDVNIARPEKAKPKTAKNKKTVRRRKKEYGIEELFTRGHCTWIETKGNKRTDEKNSESEGDTDYP